MPCVGDNQLQDQAHASTPATKLINCRSGGRWRTAYGTTYIPARPDRWSRGGNWPCDHWDCPGGSFSAAEYSWCGRSGKRRSKSGKARWRCHREYAVLSPAGPSGLSPLLPATRQALLQARTPVLLLKLWSAGVSEWASSSVRKRAEIPSASSLGPTFGPLRAIGSGTTIWSEGACALPLQWSLPRPRKPRPSPEKARFLFLLAPFGNRALRAAARRVAARALPGSTNADETTLSAFLPPEIVRAAVRGGLPWQVGLSSLQNRPVAATPPTG